jgi:hypothetical protein
LLIVIFFDFGDGAPCPPGRDGGAAL